MDSQRLIRQRHMDRFNASAVGSADETSWEADTREFARRIHGGGDIRLVFSRYPEGTATRSTPWPRAPRYRDEIPVTRDERFQRHLRAGRTVMVDPRILHATQSNITSAALAHYLGPGGEHYRLTGEPYADKYQLGNLKPIVETVRSRSPNLADYIHKLHAGHHRSTAALLKGELIEAIWIPPDDEVEPVEDLGLINVTPSLSMGRADDTSLVERLVPVDNISDAHHVVTSGDRALIPAQQWDLAEGILRRVGATEEWIGYLLGVARTHGAAGGPSSRSQSLTHLSRQDLHRR